MARAHDDFLDRLGLGRGRRLGWRRAVAVLVLCTVVSELMVPYADLQDVIMVYLAGVVYVALHEGLRTSIATVLAGIFLFDLLVVPPRWGLNPVHPGHLVTLAVMLGVGLLISSLSSRAQRQTELAERRALRAQVLNTLAAQLASARSPDRVEAAVSEATTDVFGAGCRIDEAGSVQLDAGAAQRLSEEERELLEGFTQQVRLALDRCTFEARSRQAMVEAEGERLRNTLLSGISHDFRTPLTTIIGAATSLQAQHHQLDAGMRASLVDSILGEANRLHERVSHLLDLTRIEEGAVPLSPEWCPADDLVAEALAALGPRTRSHRLQVDAAPDAVVWCDPRLIGQAVANLVDNALRYAPSGSAIRIGVQVGADCWRLRVADSGPGLPPGAEQEVFRKFHRGQREAAGTGFGLGLAICAAVARLHGGTIDARTDGGAVFTLTLPQPQAPRMAEDG